MPDPNNPNQNPPNTAASAGSPPVSPVIPLQTDLPPLPPDFQNVGPSNQPVSQPVPEPSGSSAPPTIPPVISTPKKKFGGGRIIATILGFLILAGGIVGGVILTQQQQDIREKASILDCGDIYVSPCTEDDILAEDGNTVISPEAECTTNCANSDPAFEWGCNEGYYPCNYGCCKTATGGGGGNTQGNWVPAQKYNCPAGTYADFNDRANSTFTTCRARCSPQAADRGCVTCCNESESNACKVTWDESSDVRTMQVAPCKRPSTPTTPPAVTAECQDIKVYTETWAPLSATQLSQLKVGDKVNFCVRGTTGTTTNEGTFDKAKFTINGVTLAETTTRRPGSTNEFCQLYTIAIGAGGTDTGASANSIGIFAQIHHVTAGWIGGK